MLNNENIIKILKNMMVDGISNTENEKLVFGIERKGFITHSIYNLLCIKSKDVKKKYNEEDFNEFIKNNSKKIEQIIEYMKEDL